MSDTPRAYATYFDSGYLSRGLTLIDSLRRHGDHAPVWILTLDDATKRYLDDAALPGVTALTIADIEAAGVARHRAPDADKRLNQLVQQFLVDGEGNLLSSSRPEDSVGCCSKEVPTCWGGPSPRADSMSCVSPAKSAGAGYIP